MVKTFEIPIGAYYYKGSSNYSVILKESHNYGSVDVYTNYNEKIATVSAVGLSNLVMDLIYGKYT